MHREERPPYTRDLYREVTDRIIAVIEAGAPAFHMPWHRGASGARPVNAATNKLYQGVNILALWATGEARGYSSGYWGSYRQWLSQGGQVRRGERATIVVFYRELHREQEDDGNGTRPKKAPFVLRASRVFNSEQVDGWCPPEVPHRDLVERIAHVEEFVAQTEATIKEGGDRACYIPRSDYIRMPERSRFVGTETISPTESYYATLLHELVHWTGNERRLDRMLSTRFGDEAYAMEELVAELGAAFLCADLAISNTPRPDHAAYVASWLSVLKRDTKAIFTASGQAARAAAFLGNVNAPQEARPRTGESIQASASS